MAEIQRPVMIDWQISSYFGWGVYGLNLMLNWIQQQKTPLLTVIPVTQSALQLETADWAAIQPSLNLSWDWQARMSPLRGQQLTINMPMLRSLRNDFEACMPKSHGVELKGAPDIGVTFFESTLFSSEGLESARPYPLIIAGSSWNQAKLDEAGVASSAIVLQGIDSKRYHPGPKEGWFAGRFAVFSGGKLEYRKGQDLVLKAFRIFALRHPDALLVAAWASPWPQAARSFDACPGLAPVTFHADGKLNTAAWIAANGLPAKQFIDLGTINNREMPQLCREMDVAIFPNRAEGGTNLVAMECMACGVPVVLSANTGHLDLIAPDRCYPLMRQSPIDGVSHRDWGESDVEEMVELLETVREDREASLNRAAAGAAFMRDMTWASTARQMAETIAPYV